MNSLKHEFLSQYIVNFPVLAYTRSGVAYNPNDYHWKFRDGTENISINFDSIPRFAVQLIHGLKVTLIWRFENFSPLTAQSEFKLVKRLLRAIFRHRVSNEKCEHKDHPIEQISSQHIINFRSFSRSNETALAQLAAFLKKWHGLGAAGIGNDVIKILDKITIRDRPKGVAVSTLCPKKGPFSDLEFEAIQAALNVGFKAGDINEEDYLLAWLCIALGGRPSSMAALKLCDLIVPLDLNDGSDYGLNLPMVKQRGSIVRDQFISLILLRQIAEPLHLWVSFLHQKYSALMADPFQAPLFPAKNANQTNISKGFEFHPTSQELGARVTHLFANLGVHSERLNQAMRITPVRFRRTYGTRLAEEGCSAVQIGRLMGHTNSTAAEIYVALTDRMIERIDKATAFAMAPIAQAFSGRIINTEADATRPSRESRIIDFRIDQSGAGLGSCGQHSHCSFSKPVSCYECSSFEPWLDGPHEAAFDYMLHVRAQLAESTDIRIAKVNDRAILGCAQVVIRIRKIKG